MLEVIKVILSWPFCAIIFALIVRKQFVRIFDSITDSNIRRAKVGPFEFERELGKLAEKGDIVVDKLSRLHLLMAESRLLELEMTFERFGAVFTDDQQDKMRAQIEEFRKLTKG